jgi:phage-related minor tail protein
VELDSLKFTVETTALDDAITKVGNLQLAVKKLGADTGSQTARQAAKEQAQITLDQVKAETALIEARGKQAKAIEKLSEPQEKLTKAAKDTNAVLERQERIYDNMISYGLSKGQASTLAMAQAQDIAADSAQKLVGTMKDIHKYIGGEAFDKSTAGMDAMRNRYDLLVVAAKNYAEGSVLNIKQAQELALDTERLSARNAQLGLSATEAASRISLMTNEFKTLAAKENEQSRANDAHAALIKKNSEIMAAAERARVEAHLNSGQVLFDTAQLRLKQEQQTHAAVMGEMSSYYKNLEAQDAAHAKALAKQNKVQVDTTGNAAVALFVKDQEKKAKAVEKSANDQAKAYDKVQESLARLDNRIVQMSGHDPISKTAANELFNFEKQLKASGVAADQASVLLEKFRAKQKQVSDLSSAEELKRMEHLSRALAPQVTDISVGLMTGQNPLTIFLQQGGQIRDQIGLSQVATENLGKVFKDTFTMMGTMVAAMGKALLKFMATPLGMIITLLATVGVALYKAAEMTYEYEKAMHQLNTALILSGNQAGLTSDNLVELTKEASKIEGISFVKGAEAMSLLAKTGEIAKDEFVKTTESAVLLEKYAGIAISETVKAYKELSKEPLKALIKINEETGYFTTSIIKQVAELERQGEKEAAAELARKSYADATVTAAHNIQDSLQGLSKAMDIATTVGEKMWKVIKGGIGVDTNEAAVKSIAAEIARIEDSLTVKQAGGLNIRISNPVAERMLNTLKEQLTYNQHIVDSDRDRAKWQEESAANAKLTGEYQLELNKSITTEEKKRREIARIQKTSVPTLVEASLDGPEALRRAIDERNKAIHDIETGKKGDKKPKEESANAFSISLTNELQQYEKQYAIEIKLQDDFIRQEKARLDNALSAKEITQGEFNSRDIAASEKGYTDRQKLSDSFYSGIISKNEKNISEMSKQYLQWVSESSGTPKFAEKNAEAIEELRKKIINANNETSVFIEKIQASATSAKETAFTRFSKQLSILKGEIVGINLAYSEYLQSEANLTKQKQQQISLEDKLRFASPEQAAYIKASADETERLTKQVQEYDKQIRAAELSLGGAAEIANEQFLITGKVTEQTQILLDKEKERYDLLVKTKGLAESTSSAKAVTAGQDAQLRYQKDQMKALSDSVAGAIEIGLYEGGDAGSKALRKIIEAELRKPITIFIKAIVGDLTSQVTNSLTGGKQQDSSLWLKDFGLATTNSIYELGGALTTSGFESLGNSVTGLAGSVSKYSSEITLAADALSYFNAASLLAEGKYGSAAGSAIGTYFGGPIGGQIGQQIGSLLDGGQFTSASSTGYSSKAFSGTGIETNRSTTTLGAGNIVDALYNDYAKKAESLGITKAATEFSFSSNTGREGKNPNFTLSANAGGKSYLTATDNPSLFGANEIAMTDANMQLQASRAILTALQGSELPKYLKGAFDNLIVGSMDAASVQATFDAASALKLFHDQLQLLPFDSLKDLSYTATEALKVLSGGLDKFSENLSTYYDKFYSDSEKTAILTKNTKNAFESLGQVMPVINEQTRANYRALVEELAAKDLSIVKNAAAYAGVLQLAGAMDKLAPAINNTVDSIVDLAKTAVSSAMTVLSNAIKAQKEKLASAYNEQLDKYNLELTSVTDSISKLSSLASQLKSTMDGMRIIGSEGDYRVIAQAQIQAALNTARSGGGLHLAGELTSALATVSKPSEQLFGSFEDYARDFYKTANNISELSNLTDAALSADQITQSILKEQIKVLTEKFNADNKLLDDILSNAQKQLDTANGINTTLLSVADALLKFNSALEELLSIKNPVVVPTKPPSTGTSSPAGLPAWAGPTGAPKYVSRTELSGPEDIYNVAIKDPAKIAVLDSVSAYLASNYDGSKESLEQLAKVAAQYGITQEQIAQASGYSNQAINRLFGSVNIPSFDIGTNFVPRDMLANIHEGERIIPAADNAVLMQMLSQGNNNELKEELKDMKVQLKNALDKISENTKQTRDILDNVTAGGSAMLTEVA